MNTRAAGTSGHEDQMGVQHEHARSARRVAGIVGASVPRSWGVDRPVPLPRLPDAGPAQALARAFGCARVVFNDGLRRAGRPRGRGEAVRHRRCSAGVVTVAKPTPEREWLGEVASVALVQACQDAAARVPELVRLAVREAQGPQGRPPRFRSRKDNRQSIRFTRNGFARAATTGGCMWRRSGTCGCGGRGPLPSVPSSVTVIREADGRYYASFVVERAGHAAAAESTGGRYRPRADPLRGRCPTARSSRTPRHLRRAARGCPGAAGAVPQAAGSNNRNKAVRRVAVLHRKVRETRLDGHHKLLCG